MTQRTQREFFYKKILGAKGQHVLSNVACDDNSEILASKLF